MHTTTSDVLIIGGGVIGTSIAYFLSLLGIRVILLDKGELAGGTSGACHGLIFLQSKKPGLHLQLALASQELYAELEEELPRPIGYRNKGGLVVMERESEIEAMQAYVHKQQENGLEVRLLDRQQLLEIEPCLSPKLCGAAFSALDSQVDPIALTQALALGARERGAQLFPRTEVLNIARTRAGMHTVHTRSERFEAEILVNAAGVWAPEIGSLLGLDLPITPRRGQILVTESLPRLLGKSLISARYMHAKYQTAGQDGPQGGGVSMEQTENGNLLLGSTR
ncbi:MAG: FAD-binding oxidoreductase, partial [Desulfohalobiaceae bacterium]|nr:FAD-binding oxidoreductase [Desulfohalobiaceae bacterium]